MRRVCIDLGELQNEAAMTAARFVVQSCRSGPTALAAGRKELLELSHGPHLHLRRHRPVVEMQIRHRKPKTRVVWYIAVWEGEKKNTYSSSFFESSFKW